MISAVLCVLFGIATLVAIGEGETGPAVLGAVIILVVLFAASVERQDTKA